MPRRSKGQRVTTAPGQTYGMQAQEADAQRAVPLPTAPEPVQPSASLPAPGANPLIRPTERPSEPVTEGMNTGPGAGREALEGSPTQSVADQLRMLAMGPNSSPIIEQLAHTATTLGL